MTIQRAVCMLKKEHSRFFLGPNRAVVPKPIDEANRYILGHLTPKTLQKALCVAFIESV
jgi:hypothetical protein